MPVGTNPRNTALFTLEYSTDGTNFTSFGTEVVDVQPNDNLSRKMIERRLLNTTFVDIFPARIDYQTLKVILEYSSATYTTVLGWFTNKTLIFIRLSADDTGGTNNSRHRFSGYVMAKPPAAPGDDQVALLEFTVRCRDYTFTAAA